MTYWDVLINGQALNTNGSGVSDLTGFGTPPPRAFYTQDAYGRDGEVSLVGGLNTGVFGMTVWVDDCDRATGVRPLGDEARAAKALENYMWLVGLVTSDYAMQVAVVVPGSAALSAGQKTRVATAQLLTLSEPKWNSARNAAEIVLGFKNPSVYWRALGGGALDSSGYATVSGTGNTAVALPTDVYPMNGYIEDAFITVNNGATALRSVDFKSSNAGSGGLPPELLITTPRTAGLLAANGKLEIDCKAYTAYATVGTTVESVFKFADPRNGRIGSMLRIGPPYTITPLFTPLTAGAAVTGVTWSIKYRPSFF